MQKKIVRTSVILSHGVSVQRCTRPVRRRLQEMPSPEEAPSAGLSRRKAFSEQRQAKERISSPGAHALPPGYYCTAESARKLLRQMVTAATASDTAVQPGRHTEDAEAPLPSFNRCLWKPGGSEASSPPLSPAGKERKKAA